jgi:CIC family chloride channel protein
VPLWLRPAVGGLALGVLAVVTIWAAPRWFDVPASHVAVLGGGYGNAQLAITGSAALGVGATGAIVLVAAALLRVIATSLTIGTGASAGDFAPALAIGALVGGAIGHGATEWAPVDGISIAAFALVGMATFYGGIAKAPLAATVMVCEMAGSYDLLVPLMLAQAIAFVALRRVSLYPAQLPAQRHSPAHAAAWARREIAKLPAGSLVKADRPLVVLGPRDPADRVLRAMADAPDQPLFPVVDEQGQLRGLVTGPNTREVAADDDLDWAVAADLMVAPASVHADTPLAEVARVLIDRDLRAIPVLDAEGRIVGLVDEHDVSRAYVGVADDTPRRSLEMRAVTMRED